jgi:DNA-binding MarR family transcriptional regulator
MMAKGDSRAASPNATLLTEIVLLVFRVNGRLLSAGDRLVGDLGLTSARWQMLGAVALSDHPRTAPLLAARMGMTRQAAQKQLDLLMEDGLVAAEANPGHARSPLYVLTRKGTSVYAATERLQAAWANRIAGSLAIRDLEIAKQLLDNLSNRLNAS